MKNTKDQQSIPKYFQISQDIIAQMSTEIEAARLLVYKAAWQKDQGNLKNVFEVTQAKYYLST